MQKILSKKMIPYILITPTLIYYLIFWLRPVISAIYYSFFDENNVFTLNNYAMIFKDPYFKEALINTAIFVLVSVTLEFVIALGLALIINKKFKGAQILLSIALIPMALPAVAVGAMWSSGFATYGWVNSLLYHLGIITENGKIAFLAGSDFQSLMLIILIDAWQVIPFMMVILLAGLQGLSKDSIEAGYIFGGTKFTVLRKITLPMLKPSIQTALILRIISAIQVWLIIVMIYGYRRIPVLLEEVVFYEEQLLGFYRVALAYSVIVAAIVSIVSIIYLKVSGAFEKGEQ
ncbi:ABC transporter permease [Thermosipho melanesiensis]|uniref:Binding-protein-dependent transport systems inner membrane component n=3 Tax=Thermosipho melanesiensis TaxID=46541 RepID=A6LNQ2_THEM4|nr:sugar ABC transporter permease [Thermosipho melanesiensis]ABR31553.1 binding-protein-dependent transport systems inner membrane component [Thermosipho melanesiensis BI429]APT74589.1 ABC transporter permease [Thermosipho melanesiensis]OOC35293.1 ABC transporter permease [Thermosipho melanesiensis]OOC35512.1 ABC transporter permease [Thermosipho melanesiensis]OOC36548.1 ABC transporter permease [Thermosipho melanesiensis]